MAVELTVNGEVSPQHCYLDWAPQQCQIRQIDGTIDIDVDITTENGSQAELSFYDSAAGNASTSLQLQLRADGTAVSFWVSGTPFSPSLKDNDAGFELKSQGNALVTQKVMVRVRKDANRLTDNERDRFVEAFAKLNDAGQGPFKQFRDMHTRESNRDAHGGPGFLPWHRAYLLDLERELQNIEPSVTLPYWRFDLPAPNLFHQDFIGISGPRRRVRFSSTNNLQYWSTDGVQGIIRVPFFDTSTQAANVRSEVDTLALGGQGQDYTRFRSMMQGNPHGSAHVSFDGFISSIPSAAKDPLFFLLHCNVDRLWAKWQWANDRFDSNRPNTFPQSNSFGIGHNLNDTMWPWNGVTGLPRPPTAPGGRMPPSDYTGSPGDQPEVKDLIDIYGNVNANARLGFAYDDVPRI